MCKTFKTENTTAPARRKKTSDVNYYYFFFSFVALLQLPSAE